MIFSSLGLGVVAIVSVTGAMIYKVVKDANDRESLKELEENIKQVLQARASKNNNDEIPYKDNEQHAEEGTMNLGRSYKAIAKKNNYFSKNIKKRDEDNIFDDEYIDQYEDEYDDGYEEKYKKEKEDDTFEMMRAFERNFFRSFGKESTELEENNNFNKFYDNDEK